MLIPFKINTYEVALTHVTQALNTRYNDGKTRWRVEKTELKNNSEVYEFRGRMLIETFNEAANLWTEVQRSEEFTVATRHDREIDNYAFCKTMIKFYYFCAQSLGAEIEFDFENENLDKNKRAVKEVKSWVLELKEIDMEVVDVAKFERLVPFKQYVRQNFPRFPLDQLIQHVKDKKKNEKITLKDLCDVVFSASHSRAARKIAKKRPAKKAIPPHEQPAKVVEPSVVRNDAAVVAANLSKKGITKSNFAEKCPEMQKKYTHLSVFIANCTDNELVSVLNG